MRVPIFNLVFFNVDGGLGQLLKRNFGESFRFVVGPT